MCAILRGMSAFLFENDEHRALREQVRRWSAAEIAPHAHDWEEAEEFPRELYAKAGAADMLGIGYPESCGGSGGDITHIIVAAEEKVAM